MHPPTRGAPAFRSVWEMDGTTGAAALIAEMMEKDFALLKKLAPMVGGVAPAEDGEDASTALSAALPEAEVSVVNGGQPVYYFMISIE